MEILNAIFWLIVIYSFLLWLISNTIKEKERRNAESERAWRLEGK